MKSLDEVIRAHEFCINSSITGAVCEECPAFAKPDCQIREDALHYLKEYRNKEMFYNQSVDHMVLMMNEHEDRVAMYLAEMHKNNPLTWSELKQMEGKPVWLEDSNREGEWVLLSGMEDDVLYFVYRTCNEYKIYRKAQGALWQAYRKERE